MVTQSLKDRETECLLLWHLKPSCPWIQQVSSSSAQGLVIHCWGRDFAQAGGAGTKGLGGGKGMMDGPRGECQNHKSNLNLTPSSYKVYLHFHIASTFKTSMFRHLKAAWRPHMVRLASRLRQGARISLSQPDLTNSRLILPFKDDSKNLLSIAGLYREFLFILSSSCLNSFSVKLGVYLETFRTLNLLHLVPDIIPKCYL